MRILRLLPLAALALVLTSMTQPSKTFTITATLRGLADGTKVQLVPGSTHAEEDAIAEAVVSKGKTIFKGALEQPLYLSLRVQGSRGALSFFAENSNIEISAEVSSDKQEGVPVYNFRDVVVKGSKIHEEFLQKTASRGQFDKFYEDYHIKNKTIIDAINKARSDKNKNLADSLTQTPAYKQFEKDEHDFFTKVEETFKKSVEENKNTWWGPFLMLNQTSYLTPDQRPIYESFPEDVKSSYYGRKVNEELYPVCKTGQKVQDFSVVKSNGEKAALASLISNKKYILIDFWASWCHPCRAEIPNLKKLYSDYSSNGLEIISISIDDSESAWLKALKEERLPWPNFRDVNGIAKLYKVKAVPTLLLIDQNGILLADDLRGEPLANKLKEVFSQK